MVLNSRSSFGQIVIESMRDRQSIHWLLLALSSPFSLNAISAIPLVCAQIIPLEVPRFLSTLKCCRNDYSGVDYSRYFVHIRAVLLEEAGAATR